MQVLFSCSFCRLPCLLYFQSLQNSHKRGVSVIFKHKGVNLAFRLHKHLRNTLYMLIRFTLITECSMVRAFALYAYNLLLGDGNNRLGCGSRFARAFSLYAYSLLLGDEIIGWGCGGHSTRAFSLYDILFYWGDETIRCGCGMEASVVRYDMFRV